MIMNGIDYVSRIILVIMEIFPRDSVTLAPLSSTLASHDETWLCLKMVKVFSLETFSTVSFLTFSYRQF